VIFPQSWIHNANIYGFLKILATNAEELEVEVEELLREDGTLVLPDYLQEKLYEEIEVNCGELYPRLYVYWIMENDRIGVAARKPGYDPFVNIPRSMFTNNDKFYKNLIPQTKPFYLFSEALSRIVNYLFKERSLEGDHVCILCGNPAGGPDHRPEPIKTFSPQLFGSALSSWVRQFPNSFWNMQTSLYICNLCAQMALFRHFVFRNNGDIFINAPSFKVIWYLNQALKAYKDFYEIFSVSSHSQRVDFSVKVQRLLGTWEKQNIEIVMYAGTGGYHTYYFPSRVVDILINPRVTSILGILRNSEGIFRILALEKYPELLHITYLSLKQQITQNNEIRKTLDRLGFPDPTEKMSSYLPILFFEVRRILGVNHMGSRVCPNELREFGMEVKELFKNTKYRLLELVRLGKKDEVYHLVLRTYMAAKRAFPEKLNEVFKEKEEDFKNLMYAYISGMTGGE